MWRKLQASPPYFIITTQTNGFDVYVTDYVAIWFAHFTDESFLSCLQDSNFGLEIDSNELIEKGTNLLLHPDGLKKLNIAKNPSALVVAMSKMFEFPLRLKLELTEGTKEMDSNFGLEIDSNELIEKGTNLLLHPDGLKKLNIAKNPSALVVAMSKMFEFPLRLKLELTEGTKEMFFQKITHMLLKTISDLQSSQQELRDLLKKKDDEIDEYKCEGKEIALRYLKTERFNDDKHMKRHQVFNENGELLDISDTLLETVAAAANETEIVKQENTKNLQIKQEQPQTQLENPNALSLKSSSIKEESKTDPQKGAVSPRKKQKLLNY